MGRTLEKSILQADKSYYEYNNLSGTSISEESYIALTGNKKPVKPTKPEGQISRVTRTSLYVSPSVEFSTQLNPGGKKSVCAGVRVQGNIPVVDRIDNPDVNADLSKTNREYIKAGLFLNF